jgi:hypothetical protein
VSIYALPPEALRTTQPINALRARQGLRPLCYDRPDFPETVWVNSHTRGSDPDLVLQVEAPISNPMSKDCKAWAVHPSEDPGTESVPAREGWRCLGCRHLPCDPRVVIAAAGASLW